DPLRAGLDARIEGPQRVLRSVAARAAMRQDGEGLFQAPTLMIFISLVPPGPVKSPLVISTRSPSFSRPRFFSASTDSRTGARLSSVVGAKSTGYTPRHSAMRR